MRVVTVTGHSATPSERQRDALRRLLAGADKVFHGVCVGADEAGHEIALDLGIPVEGFPGFGADGRSPKRFSAAPHPLYVEHGPLPYMDRNDLMVKGECTEVAALVHRPRFYRSGEWATINRAHRAGKRVTLITPDGRARDWAGR